MRLIGLSMVKNESDIIEAFIRHNLDFLDALYIIENGSVDGTREILVGLQREGLPLVIFDDPRFGYFQAEKMTALFRNVCEFIAPDFCFLLDADEFIEAASREFLEEQLATLPRGVHGLMSWKTYVLSPTADLTESNPLRRITYRRKMENPMYYKVVIATNPDDNAHLCIAQGNHAVSHADGKNVPQQVLTHFSLAHFPVRSPTQLITKILSGWLAYLAKDPNNAASAPGYQWRSLYQRLAENPDLTLQETSVISLNYYAQPGTEYTTISSENTVLDPMPVSFTLRHQSQASSNPLSTIARTMEYALAPAPATPFVTSQRQALLALAKHTAEMAKMHHSPLFLDLPPFRYLADKYQPHQVLDIGCGLGGYIRMFQEWGTTEVLGIERTPEGDFFLSKGNFLLHDLRQPLDLQQTYDLVVCLNVIEHIDERYEGIVLRTIHRHAKDRIIFAAAEPAQPGRGYVNRKSLAYWLAAWQQLGWIPDVFDSLAVRSLSTFSWLRRNLIILVRGDHASVFSSPFTTADLEGLARYPFRWSEQYPNVYTSPLSELSPSPLEQAPP